MTLSKLTHATVSQCDEAAAASEAKYRAELAEIQAVIAVPRRRTEREQNALARTRHLDRLKKIKAYRAILAAEQPTGGPTDDAD